MGALKDKRGSNESVLILVVSPTRLALVKNKRYRAPLWKLPGGSVESTDKNQKAAAIRECQEETGIRLLAEEILEYSMERHEDGHCQHLFIAQVTEEKLDTRLKVGNEDGHPIMVAAFDRTEVPTMPDLLEVHRVFINDTTEALC